MVVVQERTESRTANNRVVGPVVVRRTSLALDELASNALVKSFGQIVLHEFLDHVAQMPLSEKDEVFETLVFDCLYESLRVQIAIRTLRANLHAVDTRRPQNRGKRFCEQWISVWSQDEKGSRVSIS
jgi:hypothetical protein